MAALQLYSDSIIHGNRCIAEPWLICHYFVLRMATDLCIHENENNNHDFTDFERSTV